MFIEEVGNPTVVLLSMTRRSPGATNNDAEALDAATSRWAVEYAVENSRANEKSNGKTMGRWRVARCPSIRVRPAVASPKVFQIYYVSFEDIVDRLAFLIVTACALKSMVHALLVGIPATSFTGSVTVRGIAG